MHFITYLTHDDLFSLSLYSFFVRFASSATTSTTTTTTTTPDTKSPRQVSTLTFNEYKALKRRVTLISRIGGIPFSFAGLITSSFVFASSMPHLFDGSVPPEQIPLIL